ncbi:MAG TPA: fumarylacetoacetase [Burkholderiales bacterium]|nr:fumarylacetoacetase [Burkholderiales bacterium]
MVRSARRAAKSWVESANDPKCDFPLQNLPYGVFRRRGSKESPRGGVAIGDQVLDLAAVGINTGPNLNRLAAAGRNVWRELRRVLTLGLSDPAQAKRLSRFLVPMKKAEMFLPVAIGDYSDFYAGIHHALAIGRMFRPDNPLLPNYKWVPIGYHGRASSVVVSGTPVVRPHGQTKAAEAAAPSFGPAQRLDYEAELGFVIGPGSRLGKPVGIRNALEHVFGVVLLNDWSARDVQAWEYQPLGPFLSKSFATTISPWIVTFEALEPFRCAAFERPSGDPRPLPYLFDTNDQEKGGLEIGLEMYLSSETMRKAKAPPLRLSRGNARDAYWTAAQMLAHHSSNGCNLQPGDLLGSGTLSGATPESAGSLMELTQGGKVPLQFPGGESRIFIEDGDEVTMRGRCERQGAAPIGWGECTGAVRAARTKRQH